MITTENGTTTAQLFTDEHGRTLHLLWRAGGSLCLYYLRPGAHCHFVLYDTLDNRPPTPDEQALLDRIAMTARLMRDLCRAADDASWRARRSRAGEAEALAPGGVGE